MTWRLYGMIGAGLAFAALLGALLWLRGDLAKANGDKKALGVELVKAVEANKEAAATIEGFRTQRVDNDAIAEAVFDKLKANRAIFDRTTVLLKDARNDPNVKPWADTPIPGRVQDALNSDEVREPPR